MIKIEFRSIFFTDFQLILFQFFFYPMFFLLCLLIENSWVHCVLGWLKLDPLDIFVAVQVILNENFAYFLIKPKCNNWLFVLFPCCVHRLFVHLPYSVCKPGFFPIVQWSFDLYKSLRNPIMYFNRNSPITHPLQKWK